MPEMGLNMNSCVCLQAVLLLCAVMAVCAHPPSSPQSGEVQTESLQAASPPQPISVKTPQLQPVQAKTIEPFFRDDVKIGGQIQSFTPSQPHIPLPSPQAVPHPAFTHPQSVLPHHPPTSLSHELFQRHVQLASSSQPQHETPQRESSPQYSKTQPSSQSAPASSFPQPAPLLSPAPKDEGARIVSFNSIVSYYGRFKPASTDQAAQVREAPHHSHLPSQAVLSKPLVSKLGSTQSPNIQLNHSHPFPQHDSIHLPPSPTSPRPVTPESTSPESDSRHSVSSPPPPAHFLSAPPLPQFFNPETFQSARLRTSTLRPELTQSVLSHVQPAVPQPVSLERSTLIHAQSQPVVVRVVAPKITSSTLSSITPTSAKSTTTSESTTSESAITSQPATPQPPLDQMTNPTQTVEDVSFRPLQHHHEPATSLTLSSTQPTSKKELRRQVSFKPSITYHNSPRPSNFASINTIIPSHQPTTPSRPAPLKKTNSVKVTAKPVTPTTVLLKPVSHQPDDVLSDITSTSDEFTRITSFPSKTHNVQSVSRRPVLRRPVSSQQPTTTITRLADTEEKVRHVTSLHPGSFKPLLHRPTYFHPISRETSSPKPTSLLHKTTTSKHASPVKKVVREVIFKPTFRPILLRPTLSHPTSPSPTMFLSSFPESAPLRSPSFLHLPKSASLTTSSQQPALLTPSSPQSASHQSSFPKPGSSQPTPEKRAVRKTSYLPASTRPNTGKSVSTKSDQKDARNTRTAPQFNYPLHPVSTN